MSSFQEYGQVGPNRGSAFSAQQPGAIQPGSGAGASGLANNPYAEFKDAGISWYPGAQNLWLQNNRINPNTGAFEGDFPLPPHQVALAIQGQEDVAVWNYRQKLLQDATSFAQGGLGLLQSYRPGGSAALESGVYQNLANISLNRAALTQPLDLLGDYRRHELAKAQGNAQQQQAIGNIIGGVGAVASLAGAFFGAPGVGAPLQNAGQNISNQGTQNYNDAAKNAVGQGYAGGSAQGGVPGQQGNQQAQGAVLGPPQPTSGPGSPQQGGSAQGGAGPSYGAAGSVLAPSSPGVGAGPQGGGGQQSGQGSVRGGQAGGSASGGGGGGAMAGGSPFAPRGPGPGADGNFTSTSHAAHAAMNPTSSAESIALGSIMAKRYEADSFYTAYSYEIQREMAARLASAA